MKQLKKTHAKTQQPPQKEKTNHEANSKHLRIMFHL